MNDFSPALSRFFGSVASGVFNHAYLIEGKATSAVAEHVAVMALGCSCSGVGSCKVCSLVEKRMHPELLHVRPGATGILQERVVEIQNFALLSPVNAERKVIIIESADRMNPTAAAKMLKILEEPPGYVIFLLTVKNRKTLLDTLCSRCEIVEVPDPSENSAVLQITEKCGVSPAEARYCFYATLENIESSVLCASESAVTLAEQIRSRLSGMNTVEKIGYVSDKLSALFQNAVLAASDVLQVAEQADAAAHAFSCELGKSQMIRSELYFAAFGEILCGDFFTRLRIIEQIYAAWMILEKETDSLFKPSKNAPENAEAFQSFGKTSAQEEMAFFADTCFAVFRDIQVLKNGCSELRYAEKAGPLKKFVHQNNLWKIYDALKIFKKDIYTNVDTLGSLEMLALVRS